MRTVTEIKQNKNPFLKTEKLKVCAYVRVSTDHTEQIDSLKNQTDYYERKLTYNSEYEFCGIFSDSGISGAKEERPGFKAMMEKAKAGEIDLIITKSISRFARNTLMLLGNVRKLKEMGVGVIFEEQKINTLNSEGELLLSVLAAIAEEERKSVCSNVRWAMQNKFRHGEAMVNTNRLLGYDKDKSGNLIVNKEQARIVRLIYKLYLEGNSAYKIAEELNKQKIPSYINTNMPWKSHRILSIISNEKYKGDCLMQKAFVTDEGREILNRGQKAKYYVEKSHHAIISKKDWEDAQKIRESRKTKTYPFTSKLRCPYCGASLIRVVHESKWVSWTCATYMQKGKSACIGMRIREEKLLEISKGMNINEPMVVEEVANGKGSKKRSEEDFRFIPASEYFGFRETKR